MLYVAVNLFMFICLILRP